jgi:nitrite reductase (NADH) large subunit
MGYRIAVIGAGHAGVEAARVAGEAGAEVTLFSNERVMPYYRPRLVMVAFHESAAADIQMHPADWYADRHIDVRLGAQVARFDAETRVIDVAGQEMAYDGIVLANGSAPVMPEFGAGLPERVVTLWSLAQAERIRQRTKRGERLVVVGGGVLGIETALRAAEFGMRVTLLERADRLLPTQFGESAAAVLLRQVTAKGVTVELGRCIESAGMLRPDGPLVIGIEGGKPLEADLCIVTIGARPDVSVGAASALVHDRGIVVDLHMQTSVRQVFAAGDVAQSGKGTRCSVREAVAKGKVAGGNMLASLEGRAMTPYVPIPLPLSLKTRDLELYAMGGPVVPGDSELWLSGATDDMVRAILLREGVLVGVQMIGTREGFDELAGDLGRKWDGPAADPS